MQYYGRENVSVDIKKKMDKVIRKKNNYVIRNFEYTLFYYIYIYIYIFLFVINLIQINPFIITDEA